MRVVVASNNTGKLKELQNLLSPLSWQLESSKSFGLISPDENGLSFVENALIKARHAALATGLPALADDSGLEVDHLLGAPGIYSSRFAGEHASDSDNNAKLLEALDGLAPSQRRARFVCVLVYLRHGHDPTPIISYGFWQGHIANHKAGDNGFGYDPIFFADDQGRHSAELTSAEKSQVSHRALAMTSLLAQLV